MLRRALSRAASPAAQAVRQAQAAGFASAAGEPHQAQRELYSRCGALAAHEMEKGGERGVALGLATVPAQALRRRRAARTACCSAATPRAPLNDSLSPPFPPAKCVLTR